MAAHNPLAVMDCDNATAKAGQIGSAEQQQSTVNEHNPAHGIPHNDQLRSAH